MDNPNNGWLESHNPLLLGSLLRGNAVSEGLSAAATRYAETAAAELEAEREMEFAQKQVEELKATLEQAVAELDRTLRAYQEAQAEADEAAEALLSTAQAEWV
jgi:hypothetical protein